MNMMHRVMFSLAIVIGGWTCAAQQVTIPFQQIAHDEQMIAALPPPGGELFSNLSSSSSFPAAPKPFAAGGDGFIAPASPIESRTADGKYFLFNGMNLGMAVLDVEMTQRCIANHSCREGNPLMPSSHAGQLSINFAFVCYSSFVSYRLKKRGPTLWWLTPTIGITAHSVGVTTSIMHN
jgi:hypothetical protein